jgi:hypothetical protein
MQENTHAMIAAQASRHGRTVAQYVRDLIVDGKLPEPAHVLAPTMHPALFAELRRIGNNANQIAHAVNSGLPPELQNAYRQAARLLDLLLADELSIRRNALRMRTAAHDSAHSQAGIELQRGVRVYPARSRKEDS